MRLRCAISGTYWEEHRLNKLLFNAINQAMVETEHTMKGGTIADATIIDAPNSTKNAQKKLGIRIEAHGTNCGSVIWADPIAEQIIENPSVLKLVYNESFKYRQHRTILPMEGIT